MIGLKILKAIDMCFYVYMLMICARCLLTWIPNLDWRNNKFLSLLSSAVDLYLDLFRRFIPPIGPFDFSPVVAMFALIFLDKLVLYVCVRLFLLVGLIS
jgi:YggT family protein